MKRFALLTSEDYARAKGREGTDVPTMTSSCWQCIAARMIEGVSYRVIDLILTQLEPETKPRFGSRIGDHALFLGVMENGVSSDVRVQIDPIHRRNFSSHLDVLSTYDVVTAAESILSNARSSEGN